jgi:hypothetical protein
VWILRFLLLRLQISLAGRVLWNAKILLLTVEKLLSLNVDIACGYVQRHSGDGLILGFLDENMRVWYLPLNAVEGKVLSGWVMAGTSCVLIRRCVFESGFRFRYRSNVTPDILFMFQVQRLGFVAKVHGDVLCGHLPEWPLSTGGGLS